MQETRVWRGSKKSPRSIRCQRLSLLAPRLNITKVEHCGIFMAKSTGCILLFACVYRICECINISLARLILSVRLCGAPGESIAWQLVIMLSASHSPLPRHTVPAVIYRLAKRQPTLCRGYNSSEIMPKYICWKCCFFDRSGDSDALAPFCTFWIAQLLGRHSEWFMRRQKRIVF